MSGKCCDNSSKYYVSDIIYDCEPFYCEGFPELTIEPCENMCNVLHVIFDALCELKSSLGFVNVNVGGGEEVFKNSVGINENFRTLIAGSAAITVTTVGDTIEIDTSGPLGCSDVYKTITTPDALVSTAVGCADALTFTNSGGIAITRTVDGTINFDGSGVSGTGEANTASNVGGGIGIFSTKVGVDLQFKSLIAGDGVTLDNITDPLEIIITSTAGLKEACVEVSNDFVPEDGPYDPGTNNIPGLGHAITVDGEFLIATSLGVASGPNDLTVFRVYKNGLPTGLEWHQGKDISATGLGDYDVIHWEQCETCVIGDVIQIVAIAAGAGRGVTVGSCHLFIQRID